MAKHGRLQKLYDSVFKDFILKNTSDDVTVNTNTGENLTTRLVTLAESIAGKENAVAGKVLSSNDFTNEYKSKLEGIAESANNCILPTATEAIAGGAMLASAVEAAAGTDDAKIMTAAKVVATINAKRPAPISKSLTLTAAAWSSGAYTITDTDIKATSIITLTLPTGTTAANYKAVAAAQLIDQSQTDGTLVLQALGTVPTVDISIVLIIQGVV